MTKQGNSYDGGQVTGRSSVETFTGRYVDLESPDPDSFALEDIAHHLSNLCRFFGATKRFYSVAEHSLLVRDLVAWMGGDEQVQQAALFHDATEAYIGDVASPLKYVMRQESKRLFDRPDPTSDFDQVEARVVMAIRRAYSLPDLDHPMVKTADMWALYIEAKELLADGVTGWRWDGTLPNGGELPPEAAWMASDHVFPEHAAHVWLTNARESLESAT